MDRPLVVFLAMEWLWWCLGLACLAAGALLGARPALLRTAQARAERLGPALPALGLALSALLAAYKVAQYRALWLLWQSAEMSHVVWQIGHGHGFTDSLWGGRSFLSTHYAFSLAALAPVFWIWESPAALAAAHGLAAGAAVLGVFQLAGRLGGSALSGWLLALLCLSHPLFSGLVVSDLEMRVYAPALFIWAAYCWEIGRRGSALLLGVLLLGTIEQMPLLFFGLALYAFLRSKDSGGRRRGALLMCAAAALFWGEQFLIDRAREGLDLAHKWGSYYAPLLEPYGSRDGLLKNALRRPWLFPFVLVFPPVKLLTPAITLLGLGLLPLASGWSVVVALAAWLPQQLAVFDLGFHRLAGHYAGPVFGPLLWCSARALARLNRSLRADARARLAGWLLAVAGLSFLAGGRFLPVESGARPAAWQAAARRAGTRVPKAGKLWCDEYLAPLFSARQYIKQLPVGLDEEFDRRLYAPDAVLVTKAWFSLAEPPVRDRVLRFLRGRGFVRVFDEDGILVLADPRIQDGGLVPLEWVGL